MTETCETTFTSIPVLDFSLVESPALKPIFLSQLREALVVVGFFYLKNTSVSADVQTNFIERSKDLFSLPLEKKLEIDMVNSKHFLGYSRLGCERTARKTDNREMFDVSKQLDYGPRKIGASEQWPASNFMFNLMCSSLRRSPLQVQMSRYISMFRARIR